MYFAATASWKQYQLCRALSVPSIPVFAYKANTLVDKDEDGRVGVNRDVSLRVAVSDHCVMVNMQFLERVWPWSCVRLQFMSDFDSWMIESGRGVLLPLPPEVVESVRRMGVRRVVSATRYSPARALVAVVCAGTNY